MKKNIYTISILAAGCLWGFMGLFRRYMGEAGFSSSGVIVLRCGVAAVFFALTLLITGPAQFKVKLRDVWCFLGSGVVSLLFFTFCYFQAMTLMSLSAAAILLYTAPPSSHSSPRCSSRNGSRRRSSSLSCWPFSAVRWCPGLAPGA